MPEVEKIATWGKKKNSKREKRREKRREGPSVSISFDYAVGENWCMHARK
jgi:hypothetical protein